jgi:hypothetical protein
MPKKAASVAMKEMMTDPATPSVNCCAGAAKTIASTPCDGERVGVPDSVAVTLDVAVTDGTDVGLFDNDREGERDGRGVTVAVKLGAESVSFQHSNAWNGQMDVPA